MKPNADRAKELTAQIPGAATEDEGTKEGLANNLMGVSPPSKPDSAKAPALKLHDYTRAPWKLAMKLEALSR